MTLITFYKRFNKLGKDYVWRFCQLVSKIILEFIIFYVISTILNPEDFGKYNYILTLIVFFTIFGEFGLSGSISKFIAEYRVKNEKKIKTLIFSTGVLFLIFSLIISIVMVVLSYTILSEYCEYSTIMIILLILMSGVNILDGIFRGFAKFRILAVLSLISGLMVTPLILILVNSFGILGGLYVHVIYYLVNFILLFIFNKERKKSFDIHLTKDILYYGVVIGFSGIAYFLYTNVDILILEFFGYTPEIAYYKIIIYLFNFIYIPFTILGQVAAPSITQNFAKKNYVRIKHYLVYLFYFFILGIMITIGTYFIFPIVVQIMFPAYSSALMIRILNVLLLLIPFKVAGVILVNAFVIPSSHGNLTMIITFIGGVFNVLLDFVFIGWFGLIGIFYATIIVHSSAIISTFIIFFRILQKDYSF